MISEDVFAEISGQPKPTGTLQLMNIKRNPVNDVYTAVAIDENRKEYFNEYLFRPSAQQVMNDLKNWEFEPLPKGCAL